MGTSLPALRAQSAWPKAPGESSGEQTLSGQEEQEPVALPEFFTHIPQAGPSSYWPHLPASLEAAGQICYGLLSTSNPQEWAGF